MAQAQVVITAVDKTQAAINSAMRGMKTLERTAKATARTLNLAFGLLTGAAFVGAFKKITDAAKQTEEGTQALERFNKAIKDPALVSAANSFVTAMVNGFTFIVELSTAAIKNIKEFGETIGLLDGSITKRDPRERGSRGRGKYLVPTELQAMENAWKSRMEMIAIEKKWAEEAKDALSKLRQQEEKNLNTIKKELEDLLDISTSITEFENSFADSIDSSFIDLQDRIAEEFSPDAEWARNLSDAIDESLPDNTDLYAAFARDIGSAMTNALAQFLFNPFENGLKGMLKGFLDVVRQIVAQIAAVEILTAIFSPFKGTSGLGGRIYKSLTEKAMGGPVNGGQPYIVGERGPELFVPNSSGGIVPNNRLGMGGGFTLAPVYNIDARGATADLSRALPGILQENNRRIFDELDRRYGIGR